MKWVFLSLSILLFSSCAQNSSYGPDYWDDLKYVVDDEQLLEQGHISQRSEGLVLLDWERRPASQNEETFEYQMYEGDTLMLVAWKFYGDYRKWKEIEAMNPGSSFKHGDKIKIPKYEKAFSFKPGGTPHLVQKGETLGKISKKRYETSRYWKNIWKHNDRLIKDPNLIFAGFTIYTPELQTIVQ
ncbi:MAG: LysM peptidoglycan-binding domain-containing protein [Halobacteriovoraceae bacterium]|nr:LysM peptidoglycan-binding domain-containing protein [Halobacteriovoraceae bacterium]